MSLFHSLSFAGPSLMAARRMTSITSIYNTSAVFAYIFSVLLLGERWRARKLVAVALATLGVMVVACGGSAGKGGDEIEDGWLGNGLALLGAVAYGFYEVRVATLSRSSRRWRYLLTPSSRSTTTSISPLPLPLSPLLFTPTP